MAWNSILAFSLLGWLPFSVASPNQRLPRARTSPTSNGLIETTAIGSATVTGALSFPPIGTGIPSLGVEPAATTYPSNGNLHKPQPAPFVPARGIGTNGTTPVYNAKSDFDYQSLALALYTEYVEQNVFREGLSRSSEDDFLTAGLRAEDRFLIQFMAEQESAMQP